MIGSRPPPTTSDSHRYGSGFQGSPVDAKRRNELRSCERTGSSPKGIRLRTSVGDRPRTDTSWRSHNAHSRSAGASALLLRRRRPRRASWRRRSPRSPSSQPRSVTQCRRSGRTEIGLERRLLGQLDQQAARRVHRTLRLAGGAGRVAEVARMLAVEGLRLEVVRLGPRPAPTTRRRVRRRERPPAEPLEHDD